MIKTFTLNKIEEEKVSERKGLMKFHLTDENNSPRVVTGITFLDENGRPKGICSSTKRELPLVQILFEMKEDEKISLEFKYYNRVFNRELDMTINQVAYEKVLEMEKEKNIFNRMSRFFKKLLHPHEEGHSTIS